MLSFGILGPLEVARDGRIVEVAAPKEQAALIGLLLQPNDVVGSDRLVAAIWGERPPRSAPKLVQLYVSHLRKALGASAIETVGSGYRLVVDSDALDSSVFERLLVAGREARARGGDRAAAATLRRALALWRGSALADVRHLELAEAEAVRLEELRLECLEERIDADLALSQHEQVLVELTTLHAEHPNRERICGQLMLGLYRSARQADALAVYRVARGRLQEELGLEPGGALRSLERAILEQSPELAAPARGGDESRSLRVPTTRLVGRARELEELRRLVEREDVRLVTLTGAGGSGKTRLATALAESCREVFADGVAFVELAELRTPELVPLAIAEALGVSEQPGEPIARTLRDSLRTRELLLVVDNFEHVVSAGLILVDLCAAAPLLTVVATSRRVLHLSGEHVYPVQPLAMDDAVALFVERAQAADRAAEAPEEDDVRLICRRLDGLPLAIELAAARTRTLGSRELAKRMEARLPLLTGGPRDLPARQQTLRDALAWSAALLSEEERAAFARLSVFVGGCSLDAALAVAGADLDLVSGLVDDSLLRRSGPEPERFHMLETVREYGLELLGSERNAVDGSHARYFADLAESANLYGVDQEHWLPRLDGERGNLRAALDHAAATEDAELELRLAGALWRFWWLRGELGEGRAHLERALGDGPDTEPRLVARACMGAAGIAWGQGDLAAARALGERGLEAAGSSGDGFLELGCHTVLGLVAKSEADWASARAHLERSAEIAAELGRERDVVTAKMNLGTVAFDSGDHAGGIELWTQVLAYDREHALDEGVGIALLNLGLASFRLSSLTEARERFRESSTIFDRLGMRHQHANALQGLAAVAVAEGDGLGAARLLAEAARVLGEVAAAGATIFDETLAAEAEEGARRIIGDGAFEAEYGRREN